MNDKISFVTRFMTLIFFSLSILKRDCKCLTIFIIVNKILCIHFSVFLFKHKLIFLFILSVLKSQIQRFISFRPLTMYFKPGLISTGEIKEIQRRLHLLLHEHTKSFLGYLG